MLNGVKHLVVGVASWDCFERVRPGPHQTLPLRFVQGQSGNRKTRPETGQQMRASGHRGNIEPECHGD